MAPESRPTSPATIAGRAFRRKLVGTLLRKWVGTFRRNVRRPFRVRRNVLEAALLCTTIWHFLCPYRGSQSPVLYPPALYAFLPQGLSRIPSGPSAPRGRKLLPLDCFTARYSSVRIGGNSVTEFYYFRVFRLFCGGVSFGLRLCRAKNSPSFNIIKMQSPLMFDAEDAQKCTRRTRSLRN